MTSTPVRNVPTSPLRPSVGALVLFCIGLEADRPVMRPAVLVRTWDGVASYPEGTFNIQVFTDGNNDGLYVPQHERDSSGAVPSVLWRTSVHFSEAPKPGCWSWPPLEGGALLAEGVVEETKPAPKPNFSVAAVLQFFAYAHLPPHLQAVSKPFCELAQALAAGPQNPETTVALRKLLESKDAAVRAVLFKDAP